MIRYWVDLGGKTIEVALDSADDGPVRAVVDGVACEGEIASAPSGIRLRVGETVLDLVVESRKDEIVLHAPGGSAVAKAKSERDLATAKAGASSSGPTSVRAPMPGRVVSILVKKGQTVEAGAPLIVVEAMKMENELRSPTAGTILEILVPPNHPVEANEELIRLGTLPLSPSS